MMASRSAAAALAASLAVLPAFADERTAYHYIEIPADTLQPCRTSVLLNMPASWQSGDGAVVMLTIKRPRDAVHDALISALLVEEHAAVLELVPVRCDEASDERDGVVAAAINALDAMTRVMGSGMTVAIGYGPGARAILDVVHASAARPPGTVRPQYAAAMALGDGAPAFVLGAPLPMREGAPLRLAALCRALAMVVGGMGETLERGSPATASEGCLAAMGGEIASSALAAPATVRQ
jgi:hypothetical protein